MCAKIQNWLSNVRSSNTDLFLIHCVEVTLKHGHTKSLQLFSVF